MKNWKKNLIFAGILMAVCGGIALHWTAAQSQEVLSLTDTLQEEQILDESTLVMNPDPMEAADPASSMDSYFAAVRLSRQQSRDSAVTVLQEAMAYSDERESSSASAKLEDMVSTALCEAQIESLVIAKGYTDCVAYMNEEGISVAVSAPEEGLSETDVALISDIVVHQADCALSDIRIVEVK